MTATGRRHNSVRFTAAALVLVLLLAFAPARAQAAVNQEGLLVEQLTFRDVLRLYALDKNSFGVNALDTDDSGVTNAARLLAEMFGYTVGLNYNGQGLNSDYFGKDVTSAMGIEPYTDANLLATYDVEISPYRGAAVALPQGETTAIRVYLTGYTSAANGVLPVLHYLWQSGGSWYAVKDDNPFYRVSYNGSGARQLIGTGLTICRNRAATGGTDTLLQWEDLNSAPDGDGVVQLDSGTLVVGRGTANIFGLTDDFARVQREGNYSSALLAVSDFVQGDTTYQTGPLVYSRSVYELATMRRVPDGELLQEGVSYRFKVVYDEALTVTAGAEWSDVSLTVRSETTGVSRTISDFTWYGGEEYLSTDRYNPHTIEFTFTPSDEGYSVCTFVPVNLSGSQSRLRSADFHTRTQTATAAAVSVETLSAQTAPSVTLDDLLNADGNAALTRGVLAEALWLLAGQPSGYSGKSFSDLGADADLNAAAQWAVSTGIMDGFNGTFGVYNTVSRADIATTLYRYAAVFGKDVSIHSDLTAWADGWIYGGEAQAALIWVLERGVLSGYADGFLLGEQGVLCGQVLQSIRMLQQAK